MPLLACSVHRQNLQGPRSVIFLSLDKGCSALVVKMQNGAFQGLVVKSQHGKCKIAEKWLSAECMFGFDEKQQLTLRTVKPLKRSISRLGFLDATAPFKPLNQC